MVPDAAGVGRVTLGSMHPLPTPLRRVSPFIQKGVTPDDDCLSLCHI